MKRKVRLNHAQEKIMHQDFGKHNIQEINVGTTAYCIVVNFFFLLNKKNLL